MSPVRVAAFLGLTLLGAAATVAAEPGSYLLASHRTNLAATMRAGGYGWSDSACGCNSNGCGGGCGGIAGCCSSRLWEPECSRCGLDFSLCRCRVFLSNLLNRIDCVLRTIYCNPCRSVCCRPRPCRSMICANAWQGYGNGCGCDYGGGYDPGMNWSPTPQPAPSHLSDPFQDDDLRSPPPVPTDAGYRRRQPQVVRTRLTSADSVLVNRVSASMSLTDQAAHVAISDEEPEDSRESVIQHISFEEEAVRRIPANPLRGGK